MEKSLNNIQLPRRTILCCNVSLSNAKHGRELCALQYTRRLQTACTRTANMITGSNMGSIM